MFKKRVNHFGSTLREVKVNSIKNGISSDFEDSPSYVEIKINEDTDSTGVWITDDTDALNVYNQFTKLILMRPGDDIKSGDIIKWNSEQWFCYASELLGEIYYRGKIIKANYWVEIEGVKVPMTIDTSVQLYRLGVTKLQLSEVSETTLIARIPNNETSNKLKEWDIIPIGRNNYRITDIQDIVEPGLLILKLERSIENETEYPEIIEPDPSEPVPVDIIGPDYILRNNKAEYSIDCDEAVFTIDGKAAKISSYTDNTCVVKAGAEYGKVILTAICDEHSYSKEITVRMLF